MDGSAEIDQRVDALVRQLIGQGATVRQIVAQVETLRQRYLTETNYGALVIDRVIDAALQRFFPTPSIQATPFLFGNLNAALSPGRIGVVREASIDDAQNKIAQSSGFQSKNLREIMMASSLNPQSRIYHSRFGQYVRQGLGFGDRQPTREEGSIAANRLKTATPQELHAFFVALGDRHGADDLREALWQALGPVHVVQLLSGLTIAKPLDPATRKRDWVHNPNQIDEDSSPAGFSRFVFDEMFDQYVTQGSRGDIVPEEARRLREARQ